MLMPHQHLLSSQDASHLAGRQASVPSRACGHAVTCWHGGVRTRKGPSSCGFFIYWVPVADKSSQHLADSDPQALAIRADENSTHSLLCHTVSAFPLGAWRLNTARTFWVGLPKICLCLGAGFLPSCGEATSAELPGEKAEKGKGIQRSIQRRGKGQAM